MSQALVKKPDPVELLAARYERLQRRDLEVTQLADRFAELPSVVEEDARKELYEALRSGTNAEIFEKYGFKNRRELRIALYGSLSRKDWPAALQAAHERVMARLRRTSKEKTRGTVNINLIQMPAPRPPRPDERIIEILPVEDTKTNG